MKKVLIVDDEPDIIEIVQFAIENEGYETLTASNAKEALAVFDQSEVDLIISDVRMPGGDGIELLDGVMERENSKPVIFVTGFSDLSVPEALDRGAAAVFSKPIDTQALIQVINESLQPPENKWIEQRQNERFDIKLKVNFKLGDVSDMVGSSVVNLGRQGMFIAMKEDLPKIGEMVEFKVSFDSKDYSSIEGTGEVRWVREGEEDEEGATGVGIEFKTLEKTGASQVLDILNDIKVKAYIPKS